MVHFELQIQYAGLPSPEKFLGMFRGVPVTHRRSILADVAGRFENSLERVVCRNPNIEVSQSVRSSKVVKQLVSVMMSL
jgi:hypothetical protein